mmetsp:Transcript_50393/g.141013  ORF Transcript_50393/g.141013 Transcript_50393/m.141013 type:complete len:82 (+) Transcript_50393:179-424(+)
MRVRARACDCALLVHQVPCNCWSNRGYPPMKWHNQDLRLKPCMSHYLIRLFLRVARSASTSESISGSSTAQTAPAEPKSTS